MFGRNDESITRTAAPVANDTDSEDCGFCGGSGCTDAVGDDRCGRCKGTGRVPREKRVETSPVTELLSASYALLPYLDWTVGPESPGCHPTLPSAIGRFRAALAAATTQ